MMMMMLQVLECVLQVPANDNSQASGARSRSRAQLDMGLIKEGQQRLSAGGEEKEDLGGMLGTEPFVGGQRLPPSAAVLVGLLAEVGVPMACHAQYICNLHM